MHHITLNGTGSNDRHLNDKIIKGAWTHARQEIHLRSALNLKHPNAICPTQHIVNVRIFRRQGRKTIRHPMMHGDQIKGFADTGQHAQSQNIHLQNTQAVDIILVPTDHSTPFHCGVLDWHQLIQPSIGHDKPANMLRQMSRKTDHLIDQSHGLAKVRITGIKTNFSHTAGLQAFG